MSEARDGLCTQCHVRLRPQVYNELRRNESVMQCESCSRILYFVANPRHGSAAESAPAEPATARRDSQRAANRELQPRTERERT